LLLDSNIEPRCWYCRYGTSLGNDEIMCIKRGIMESLGYCGAFRYEPTKRVPELMPDLKTAGYSESDFSLED